MPIRKAAVVFLIALAPTCALAVSAQNKPKITLDEFFNSVSFPSVKFRPMGHSVVIGTERADWDQQIFSNNFGCIADDGQWLAHSADAIGP